MYVLLVNEAIAAATVPLDTLSQPGLLSLLQALFGTAIAGLTLWLMYLAHKYSKNVPQQGNLPTPLAQEQHLFYDGPLTQMLGELKRHTDAVTVMASSFMEVRGIRTEMIEDMRRRASALYDRIDQKVLERIAETDALEKRVRELELDVARLQEHRKPGSRGT